MDPTMTAPDQAFWAELRRRRAELRDSMNALEQALAAPAPGRVDAWAERVYAALAELAGDFRAHIEITEGAEGLYQAVRATAPRLTHAVARLTREHGEISANLEALMQHVVVPGVTPVERVRDLATRLLGVLVQHRQRGSDLMYEAYQADIGGET